MTSTRLPGKVLKEVAGKPLLLHHIERLKRVPSADIVVVATTVNDTDDPIIELCKKNSIPFFRGSENDVLSRYFGAAEKFGADVVVRVTSDCPVIDPAVVEKVIGYFLSNRGKYDYVSNTLERYYPRGMDTEVFSMEALSMSNTEAVEPFQREHVTPYIYGNKELFRIGSVGNERDLSEHRWTVDTSEDFELIRRIIDALHPKMPEFGMEDILNLLEKFPEWKEINKEIEQKPLK
jgi:spore coat polysaccharide biosynthesis protein SpsF